MNTKEILDKFEETVTTYIRDLDGVSLEQLLWKTAEDEWSLDHGADARWDGRVAFVMERIALRPLLFAVKLVPFLRCMKISEENFKIFLCIYSQ